MKTKEKEIILDTDDKAAQLKTVTGWVSSDGRFWGNDERAARYSGCTHKTCECGNITEKHYIRCESCRGKASRENYKNYPFQEWDYKTPLCLHNDDRFFFDADSIEDYLADQECEPKDLMLVICEPNYLYQLNLDYWEDIFPSDDDGIESHPILYEMVKEFNAKIQKMKPVSWEHGKIRTEYKRK